MCQVITTLPHVAMSHCLSYVKLIATVQLTECLAQRQVRSNGSRGRARAKPAEEHSGLATKVAWLAKSAYVFLIDSLPAILKPILD